MALALVFLLAGPWLIDLMATAPEVRAEARGASCPGWWRRRWSGIAAWMLDGIFIGATETRAHAEHDGAVGGGLRRGAGVLVPAFGNHGLWAALMVLTSRAP